MPMVKIVPRGYTTCTEAYLSPVLKVYWLKFMKVDAAILDVSEII